MIKISHDDAYSTLLKRDHGRLKRINKKRNVSLLANRIHCLVRRNCFPMPRKPRTTLDSEAVNIEKRICINWFKPPGQEESICIWSQHFRFFNAGVSPISLYISAFSEHNSIRSKRFQLPVYKSRKSATREGQNR